MNLHSDVVYRLRTGVVNRRSDRILFSRFGLLEELKECSDFGRLHSE